jgi:hypothetical protein
MLCKRSRRVGALLAAMTLLTTCAISSSPATAAEPAPRWIVTAVPKATNLVPDSPASQVERLSVDATGGSFTMTLRGNYINDTTGALPYDATAGEVETAINELGGGSWQVAVSGGPGGSTPYAIEWGGYAANTNLQLRGISNVEVSSSDLTGGSHAATLTTVVTGVESNKLVVTATNVGDVATDGSAIALEDILPNGISATSVEAVELFRKGTLSCSAPPGVSCSYAGVVDPGDSIVAVISLAVGGGLPSTVPNVATVNGGGAAEATTSTTMTVSRAPDVFGVSPDSVVAALSSSQAAGHPNITTSFALDTKEGDEPVGTAKDVRFDLPVGFVGNTVGLPRCAMHTVMLQGKGEILCPAGSMVGVAVVNLREDPAGTITPVFNIAPAPGEPAAFGFDAAAVPVRLDTTVLSNGDDGVRVVASDLNEAEPAIGSTITIWGVPADHDGPGPDEANFFGGDTFGSPSAAARVPLLTAPSQCTESLNASMQLDSWAQPGSFVGSESVGLGTMTGCDELRISSSFSMVPDTLEAGAPAGYHFDLEVPQVTDPDGLGTPNVKNVSLTLPLGTVVNPSAAWGLAACSSSQFYGPNHPSQEPAPIAGCPRESQVGTVWIKTPALEEALEGQVYLAEPECHPCTPADAEDGKMIRLFVQAVSEGSGGIVVKLEGHGHIDQATGQITTVFEDNPQLPFSEFKLTLAGGPRAVLANPRTCGPATSSMDLTPWSTPATPDLTPTYTFDVDQNCFGPQFSPSFKAGMPNIQAGAHGEFTLAFGREDDSEFLDGVSVRMPEGLLGSLTGIPLCKEAEAIAGSCPVESQIGTVEALTGPGANPFLVSGGHVYLTEGYAGSQFGLSIVVPAVAGPYTLGGVNGTGQQADSGTVVVRSQIFVDKRTAQLTVTSGQLPSMLDGIPLQLKAVNVRIDKPGFMFNPTSCEKMAITGTLSAVEGMSAQVASPFQVTNCAALAFKPGFTAATKAKHSRKDGAKLQVEATSGEGQANIAKVHVELPKQLPSRLSTLQQACTEAQFEANPAGCPAASVVGTVTVDTPVLPVPLTGPAYFVSHGGAKFPELILVLQGYGVTVELNGETFISKAGITSSTFKTVPDVPFSRFVLTLPEGPHSALAANGNLCGETLDMPTTITGQNGATFTQQTKIKVKGCASSRKKAKHRKRKAKNPKGKKAKR